MTTSGLLWWSGSCGSVKESSDLQQPTAFYFLQDLLWILTQLDPGRGDLGGVHTIPEARVTAKSAASIPEEGSVCCLWNPMLAKVTRL